jgi:hypothetical protein
MQLAICWDLKPLTEEDEPRPSPHIDGSNGSVAPAVFALVHQPPPDYGTKDSCETKGHSDTKEGCETKGHSDTKEGYETKGHSGTKEGYETKGHSDTKGGCETKGHCGTKGGCETKVHNGTNEGCGTVEGCNTPLGKGENIFSGIPKSAWGETKENSSPNVGSAQRRNGNAETGTHTSATLEQRKEHKSSPNLMMPRHKPAKRLLGARPCVACELKQPSPLYRPRSEYKMAFKAGKPNNVFDSIDKTRPQTAAAKQMCVPKPRVPFAKRSYSIDTLTPPFSLWPGHMGQGYPEHWRLASVYQHAYKPMEARKKPLLASVYQ